MKVILFVCRIILSASSQCSVCSDTCLFLLPANKKFTFLVTVLKSTNTCICLLCVRASVSWSLPDFFVCLWEWKWGLCWWVINTYGDATQLISCYTFPQFELQLWVQHRTFPKFILNLEILIKLICFVKESHSVAPQSRYVYKVILDALHPCHLSCSKCVDNNSGLRDIRHVFFIATHTRSCTGWIAFSHLFTIFSFIHSIRSFVWTVSSLIYFIHLFINLDSWVFRQLGWQYLVIRSLSYLQAHTLFLFQSFKS